MSAIEAGGRGLAEHPEGLGALGRGEGADDEPRGLMRERLRERRMAVAEARDRDAGEKIDEHVAVDVGERRALAMIERDAGEQRDTLAAGRDMALLVGEQRARIRSGNRGGDFRLEAGPARGLRFTDRDPLAALDPLAVLDPLAALGRVRDLRSAAVRGVGVCGLLMLRPACALLEKYALRRPGAAGARASGSAAQSRARRPRAPG